MRSSYRMVTVPTSDGGTVPVELTGAASRLLADLEARDYLRPEPCWLVGRTDGRLALYVPVEWSAAPERLRATTRATVDELTDRGLIELHQPARNACTLAYRDSRDQYLGWPVALTDLGRQRLCRAEADL